MKAIKTSQERLRELCIDTFNAPAYLLVGCQNAEIIELRAELQRLTNESENKQSIHDMKSA